MKDTTVRWINLRGKADIVDGRHAERADNVYLDRGVVRKRHGYHQTVRFAGAVGGVFDVVIGGTPYVLVYAGRRFYLREKSAPDVRESYTDVTSSATASPVDSTVLWERPISVYCRDGKAYITGCGDYLVLKSVGDTVELRRVEDEEDTHVPTTTVGIGSDAEVKYVSATVDDQSVGTFYVPSGDDYEAVVLDGDEHTPDPGLTYYRRVVSPQLGRAYEPVNLLSCYRKNKLYGTSAGTATFRLDAACVDPDSETKISLDTVEDGVLKHYDISPRGNSTVQRAPVVGDDLSGVTVFLSETMLSGVVSLHFFPSNIGNFELRASGGTMHWECSGTSASAWNIALLYLCTPTYRQLLARATRSSIFSSYTVTWTTGDITFPADFGVISQIGSVFLMTEPFATLPVLQSTLYGGGNNWGTLDYRNATVTFTRPTTPPDESDNITVRFKHRDPTYPAERILLAKASTLYGVGGTVDRLFVGGCDVDPTADYHSQSEDWTYFAPNGYHQLGTDGHIAAYVKTPEGLLTLLKGDVSPNAFWRTGVWATGRTDVGDDSYDYAYAVFSLSRAATLPEVAADGCAGALDSDTLYLASHGLYCVYTNALTDDKKAMRLSAPLEDVTFGEGSRACVHDLRFFASNGRRVYVGDSRYRLAMDSDSNYEWTEWDIPDVSVWYRSDGVLGFGTTDGRLCVFDEGYEDVTFEDTLVGQLTVDPSDSTLSFDIALPLATGDEIYTNQSLFATLAEPVDYDAMRVYVDSERILHVYEDAAVYPVAAGLRGDLCYVADVDWGKCSFGLRNAEGEAVAVPEGLTHLVVDLSGQKILVRHAEDGQCTLAYRDGGDVTLYDGYLPLVLTARLVHRRPVAAGYAAVTNALSTPDLTKILLSATIEVESERAGEATFSVRTSEWRRETEVLGINTLRYDWLDLGAFAFDGKFPRAHTARVKMRFRFIQWKIESNNAGDMAIRGVCLRYRYLQPAKGVSD